MDHRMRLDWHDNILCFTEYMQQIGNKNNCYCTTHVLYTTRDSLGKKTQITGHSHQTHWRLALIIQKFPYKTGKRLANCIIYRQLKATFMTEKKSLTTFFIQQILHSNVANEFSFSSSVYTTTKSFFITHIIQYTNNSNTNAAADIQSHLTMTRTYISN